MRKMKQELNQVEIQKWRDNHKNKKNNNQKLAGIKRLKQCEKQLQDKNKTIKDLQNKVKQLQLKLSIDTDFFKQEKLNLQQVQQEVYRLLEDQIKALREENEKLKYKNQENEKLTQVKIEDPNKREEKLN
ncbi:hypothetical protein OXYTRIMIC_186 [Oxytricha trifallax]|uniref:Uncharacterized protein n=1 Tax=Oxytricha trifallax TaxID=1172189 RepID=A0A073HXJ1_9SPIT|nr:hypothetical protein OXYTRIMIC_186 [Oxytricha trifallax]